MKKIVWGFTILPLLALLATSCGKESVESKGDLEKIITFKAATGKQTLSRATELDIDYLRSKELEVNSYRNDDGTLYKTFNINYVGSEWTYAAPPEFHPAFGITHYSTYPAVALDATSTSTSAFFEYTIQDVANQVDLLAATATTTNASQASATAQLVYKHLLSQVNFAVAGLDGVKVTIRNIAVNNVKDNNIYTFGVGWGTPNGSANYVYESAEVTTDGTNNIIYMGNTGDIAVGSNNGNTNALMLMPQTFEPSDFGGFTFDYELKNAGDIVLDSGNAEVKFSDLNVTEWEPGKRYLYKIVFDPVIIKFDVIVVEDWVDYDGNGGVVDVDIE